MGLTREANFVREALACEDKGAWGAALSKCEGFGKANKQNGC
jgi:hypothetical protein